MVEVTLMCALVREGGVDVFPVVIDLSKVKVVGLLKQAIKNGSDGLITVPWTHLRLFLAKTVKEGDTEEGEAKEDDTKQVYVWLSSSTEDVKKLKKGEKTALIEALTEEDQELQAESGLQKVLTGMEQPSTDQIHVLVVGPGQHPLTSIAAAPIHEPHPARKKRWEELNEVLDRNKRAKVNCAVESSTGYSYVSFNDVDRVMRARRYEQPSKVIENDKIDVLHAYLLLLTKAFGEIVTGKEAKRLYFIVPVLACVCGLFNGEVRILAEETVVGKRVHGDGSFEFVIERGSQRVCIVEAKRDDFQQGLAQAYIGCEALADVEGLSKLYSIVTNYKEWYFSRSLDDRVERYDATITLVNDVPMRESVKMIAEKIYSMLSDDYPAVASNEALQ